MSRDALIIGINTYEYLSPLYAPAKDAEGIAQVLQNDGNFRIKRLPEFIDPFIANKRKIASQKKINLEQLDKAISQLFKPEGKNIPDTALLYYSGHGLRKNWGINEAYIASSDVNPSKGFWGYSLQTLQRLLHESPIKQPIVWLDCCYSGGLLNFIDIEPGVREKRSSLFLLASSREFEISEEIDRSHSVLTNAIINGLNYRNSIRKVVTNDSLIEYINRELKETPQQPMWLNPNHEIILTGSEINIAEVNPIGKCPYKGLQHFKISDAEYFYGREKLTDELLSKIKKKDINFLAIIGPSGCGKSSVVRAGLAYQLQKGTKISGSENWKIHIFTPGYHPLKSLALPFVDKRISDIDRAFQLSKAENLFSNNSEGLSRIISISNTVKTVLIIDQFEEVFTLCESEQERKKYFSCLFSALEYIKDKLLIIIVMRADFLGKCTEQNYSGLIDGIQNNLVSVKPLTMKELEEAIGKPAEKAGLRIDEGLVVQITSDLNTRPFIDKNSDYINNFGLESGSLPLLEYTLELLWKHRKSNRITLENYVYLGGVKKALENRAEEVYESFSTEEKKIAKLIFLALTQLGEGTSDTRRSIYKHELVIYQKSEKLVDSVIQTLVSERLIVSDTILEKDSYKTKDNVVLNIVHEALIRYWFRLQIWINDHRDAIKIARKIEYSAMEWKSGGRKKDISWLLQGNKLIEAENFIEKYNDLEIISKVGKEYIKLSQQKQNQIKKEAVERKLREIQQEKKVYRNKIIAIGVSLASLIFIISFALWNSYQLKLSIIHSWVLGNETPVQLEVLTTTIEQANQHEEDGKLNIAMAYYRRVRISTVTTLLDKIQNDSEIWKLLDYKQNQLPNSLKIDNNEKRQLVSLAKYSDNKLAKLVIQNRIKAIKKDLKNKKYGEVKINAEFSDEENQYTEGALKKTYIILYKNIGIGADLNNNGRLENTLEISLIPCRLIKEIEKLWNEEGCVWLEDDPDSSVSKQCNALNRKTLGSQIFGDPNSDYLIKDRINLCLKEL
ncbi:nSTAND1 domain-containing NTPase [Acaryochloris marina]|uniref:WD-40 repeat protein n=1 Tax=Acaryochloris marina (strain MBIC 11017) TaxID=329726 RepID=B0CCU8_ACAM1|nr:caspase family protein [Acaryochloris marina]ABW30390.1 WD-40 repeat protein [Acaryochloris marina MBIC11017]BDM79209.1 hypothetical protein AM10699_20770 [Acaryochloris marina MBIC10699]